MKAAAETAVLIVGGGPVGLSLAVELGWRGIPCQLIEKSDGTIAQPKMDGVNTRTMEFCRRWGLVAAVRGCPYPQNYPQDMVYLTSLAGYELGREAFVTPSGGGEERQLGTSPETRARCPQNFFDPILREAARSYDSVTLLYRHVLESFSQTAAGVVADTIDLATGETKHLRARYLIGCDGAASTVRQQLGIDMSGAGALTNTVNVIFRCADLLALHKIRPAYRHLFIGPEGTWATMVAINGRDEWRLSIIDSGAARGLDKTAIRAAIERAIGTPCDYEIVSVLPWVRRALVADSYGSGRVFLAGDAVHVMSPTGGFGMNTGIADAVDLAWKLEGAIRGWAGPELLPSYERERRPVAQRNVREASGNLLRTLSPGANPGLLAPTRDGALLRYEIGRRFSATMLREWYKLGIDLGYVYEGSPICWPEGAPPAPPPVTRETLPPNGEFADGTAVTPSLLREWQRLSVHLAEAYPVAPAREELPPAAVMIYRQSAAPGARAPHVGLADGRSTLDFFGRGFALLRLGPDAADGDVLQTAARRRGVPLAIHRLTEPEVLAAYRAPLVLVRPDGHVAWRGAAWPAAGALAPIDRVRGAARQPGDLPQRTADAKRGRVTTGESRGSA